MIAIWKTLFRSLSSLFTKTRQNEIDIANLELNKVSVSSWQTWLTSTFNPLSSRVSVLESQNAALKAQIRTYVQLIHVTKYGNLGSLKLYKNGVLIKTFSIESQVNTGDVTSTNPYRVVLLDPTNPSFIQWLAHSQVSSTGGFPTIVKVQYILGFSYKEKPSNIIKFENDSTGSIYPTFPSYGADFVEFII